MASDKNTVNKPSLVHGDNTPSKHHNLQCNYVLDAALHYLYLGYSVIPTRRDKTPAISSWKQYQTQAMSVESAQRVFHHDCNIALLCGEVSGNLECLDFDRPDLYQPFSDCLRELTPVLAAKLVEIATPSGGYHLIYRCRGAIGGNKKLAMSADGKETWIETRGEGGYFQTVPSLGYEVLENSLESAPVISIDDINLLHTLASSFTQKTEYAQAYSTTTSGQRPGDEYNRMANYETWRSLLEPMGWQFTGRVTSGGEHLTRPGKVKGTSATLKDGCLYVFSSNAGLPLGPNDAFGAYAHIKHRGNFSEAAKALQITPMHHRMSDSSKEPFGDWPEPLPLISKVTPQPYPIDALPDIVREAVDEVLSFTKAPVPLVASSALAAISLAIQAHRDVKRAEKLTGPTSLFLLTIADSGERKSTCDTFFTSSIKDYQRKQEEAAKFKLQDYKAEIDAWSAKHSGLVEKIKRQIKTDQPSDETEESLQKLEYARPEKPRIPILLRGDETPENLAWVLAQEWPSGGVISSEAGIIFGAHGMGKESIMRNLALLNILWDGGELSIGRRSSESFTMRGTRLTMALQVQEATLREFFERSGNLARGTGFLARFLIAWPKSTQGFRPFTEAPANWPALTTFNQRVTNILEMETKIDHDGRLSPVLLPMSEEAHAAWVNFHDAIEHELAVGGAYYDIRDVASKVADNAARIAALFHVFDNVQATEIGHKHLQTACHIADWHLKEAQRFFGELALPEEQKQAQLLDGWLLDQCRKEKIEAISCRRVQQYGPKAIRKKDRLTQALQALEELDRLRLEAKGRRKIIHINPILFNKR